MKLNFKKVEKLFVFDFFFMLLNEYSAYKSTINPPLSECTTISYVY